MDQREHPVTGLERGNFRVFDDGVERAITSFAMEDEPVALGLIFDRSGSVNGIRHPVKAKRYDARLFLKTSNPEDEYFLVAFASRPELAVPLTSGNEEVRYRVLTTKWGGSTALYDRVVLGLSEDLKVEAAPEGALREFPTMRCPVEDNEPLLPRGDQKGHRRIRRADLRHRFRV